MRLPKRGRLPKTGPVDWIEQYYTPGIGFILRRRLAWVSEVLPRRCERVLEVGYGSGVLQYELGARARLSIGVDPHPQAAAVRACLQQDGVPAETVRGDGGALPFVDATFDAVVIVSALEFVPDPAACLAECRRVLRPGGRFVCIIPRQLPWADAVFRTLTGHDPEADFGGARAKVQAALAEAAPDAARLPRPAWVPRALAPYELIVLDIPPRAAPPAPQISPPQRSPDSAPVPASFASAR
ncbi:MAG: class I SAM-dependent methyltransferase [Candidatus Binatia bacterium]